MAQILPLRAWRYNRTLTKEIESLTSPLFDVVSDKHRARLYANPLNSIHISVPQPPLAAERASLLLEQWKSNGVIQQDRLPGIYVYYQYFKMPGDSKEYCRKGFICNIKLYPWDAHVVLRHENTIPKSVNDRTEILEKTGLNVSPTHGLYTDADQVLERYMDEAIQSPLLESEDYQGARDVLAVIHDARVIELFASMMKGKTIILADGHHRYEGSLAHQHAQKRANPHHTGDEAYNFHTMYLTNTESNDLRILPTHRLIHGMPDFNENAIVTALQKYFTIAPSDHETLEETIAGKRWMFGLMFKENAYVIKLKRDAIHSMKWPFPEEIKTLDLTVMHYFVIEKIIGIPGREQRQSENIRFDRSLSDCLRRVVQGEAQMAVITNGVSIDDVKRVCQSGYPMPQKSTYFYPKVICGLLFSSILEHEFKSPMFSPF